MKPTLLLLFATCLISFTNPKPPLKIAILYYSFINKNLREELVQNISLTYRCTITEIPASTPLPAAAYYKPRNRYRAPIILDNLKAISGYDKVIGITTKDISTTSDGIYDWGIMGLGATSGKACIISTFRLKTPDKTLFNDRFIKVALHELGHTMGLPHCTFSRTCFMEAASGTIKSVDGETRVLCTNCKKLLNQLN